MCWISPGNVCVGSPLGNYVLDHSWETMCCISPWKLCVVSFGPLLLGPQLWFPVLARQGPWPMAHWASMCCIAFGMLCVASVLGNCMTFGTLCVASPLVRFVFRFLYNAIILVLTYCFSMLLASLHFYEPGPGEHYIVSSAKEKPTRFL